MTSETFHIPTDDGERLLCGSFRGPAGCGKGFLILPGFWGDWRREAYRELATALSAHGTVLAANMRGHAGSSGWFGFGSREHLDAAALFAEARRRELGELTAVGFSLGGWALVRHLASRKEDLTRLSQLVLVSTPARLPLGPRPWKRGLLVQLREGGKGWCRPAPRGLWPPSSLAPSLSELGDLRLSLVYGRDDWMVHERHGESLRAAAAGPCRWLLLDEARSLHAEMLALFHKEALVEAILTPPA